MNNLEEYDRNTHEGMFRALLDGHKVRPADFAGKGTYIQLLDGDLVREDGSSDVCIGTDEDLPFTIVGVSSKKDAFKEFPNVSRLGLTVFRRSRSPSTVYAGELESILSNSPNIRLSEFRNVEGGVSAFRETEEGLVPTHTALLVGITPYDCPEMALAREIFLEMRNRFSKLGHKDKEELIRRLEMDMGRED